jgi:hypothetical protein
MLVMGSFGSPFLFMPKGSKEHKLEQALKAQAKKKGLKGARRDAYVYGTLRKVMPKVKGKR